MWLKMLPIYIVTGICPYLLILWLLAGDYPQLMAGGGLSLGIINAYLGNSFVVGSLSIYALPERLLAFSALIIMSFGVALIPAVNAFRKPFSTEVKMIIITMGFPIWYYLTCLDPTSWTFMTYSCPFIAIAAGIGLSKIKSNGLIWVAVTTSVVLILFNSIFLNAAKLANREPIAMSYYNEVSSMEDGAVIVTYRGGFEAMSIYYVYSEGKDIIPIYFADKNYDTDILYQNYRLWIYKEYGIEGENTQEMVQYELDKGKTIYILTPLLASWEDVFITEDCEYKHFNKVVGVADEN
jgi:hypothetical protein